MNEHPILFSGEMVRAIRDGRKTQTRRVIKPQPKDAVEMTVAYPDGDGNFIFWSDDYPALDEFTLKAYPKGNGRGFKCPYGKPGDRLWVRETFSHDASDKGNQKRVSYKADGSGIRTSVRDFDTGERYELPWRPSIHMPRWASRLTLEVIVVRVERLNDISEEDARAEGVQPNQLTTIQPYRAAFCGLWDSINEKRGYGWLDNPWVWVVEFKVKE